MKPQVSVVLLNYKNSGETLECLSSLETQSYANFEVVVIDNGSGPEEVQSLEERALQAGLDLRLIALHKNRGATGGRNEGVKHARGDYLAFLDSDTIVDRDWLQELIRPFLQDRSQEIGATTSTVLNFFQRDQVEYGGHSRINVLGQARAAVTVEPAGDTRVVAGASFLLPRSVIDEIGEVNCSAYFFWWEEMDLSWRICTHGYRVAYVPASTVFHRVTSRSTRQGLDPVPLMTRNKYLTFYRNLPHAKFLVVLPLLLSYDLVVGMGYLLLRRDPRFLQAKLKGVAQFVRAIGEVPHIGGGALSYLDRRVYMDKLG